MIRLYIYILFHILLHYILPQDTEYSSLQYSCLENPRDGGAWWAAVYGVAQSRTRLKRLSSSSSRPMSRNFFLIFSSRHFTVGGLTVKFLAHFDLIFVYVVRYGPNFILHT